MKKAICLAAGLLVMCSLIVHPTWAQSIQTDDSIETEGQLISTVATGTAPLQVSSATLVSSLNADQLDGLEAAAFALDVDLQTVETLLVALLAQFPELGKVPLARTGQTTCYDVLGAVVQCGAGIGLGQDGDLQLGVTWQNPRFTKNGDGTVRDELTGLIWLEDADCFGQNAWVDALNAANGLFDGSTNDPGGGDCGLSDASVAGQWRLPNVHELLSLAHYGVHTPAVPNTAGTGQWAEGDPFSSVPTVPIGWYWSSTSVASPATAAWSINLAFGDTGIGSKGNLDRVWPVRGGQ